MGEVDLAAELALESVDRGVGVAAVGLARNARTRSPTGDAGPADRSTSARRSRSDTAANVVERCFNKLKAWRGIAMRTDKLARNYRAAITLAAALIWLRTRLINTP